MLNIVIAGAAGRMGKTLLKCSTAFPEIVLTGAAESPGHELLGKDAGEVAGMGPLGVVLNSNLEQTLAKADVLIDFSLQSATLKNLTAAAKLKKAVVLGATGHSKEETASIRKTADCIAIVQAPNMSLGVNLLFAMVKKAASALGPGYRVEIDETHHIHKKDAPSGTALRLGEKAADGLGKPFAENMVHDPEGAGKIKAPGKIVIRSYRKGEVIGDHTVSFENQGEKIELTHHALSREAFAMGAIRAALWLKNRKPGLYDMQDVLGL